MVERERVEFAEEIEKPIDLKYYYYLVKKNFYIILTFLIITVTLAIIYVAKIPDRYRAVAQILVESPKIQYRGMEEGQLTTAQAFSEDYYTTQREIMRSMAVMRQVVQDLRLTDYFGIENEETAANRARGMLLIERIRGSRLFNIIVTADDPQFAANLANSIGRSYIRQNFENLLYYSKEVLAWLPQKGDPNETMTIEDPFGAVRQVTKKELIESLPGIQTDATLRSLREKQSFLNAELESLLRQYREKHPVIVKARANLKFIEESIDGEKQRIIENLRSQAEGRHQVANARIIEDAQVPKAPMPSSRMRVVFIAAITELIISFVIIFLLDFFDDTIRSVEDLERKGVIIPFLGPIPMIRSSKKKGEERRAFASYHTKNTRIAEAFRYLRVAINFSATPESLKNLAVTSCLPHEGKSFVSHNIAVSLALDGNRTLLIDGDLRRPVVHKTFDVDNSTGLSNYLTSKLELDSIIKETFVENLVVIGSGPLSPNPGEILGSERMRELLIEARKRFDRVIIDCPPLTGIGDSFVIGSLIGHIILVVASGKTPADLIKRHQEQLDKTGIKIIGAILNLVDLEKERYGGYYKHYYHTYDRYYSGDDEGY